MKILKSPFILLVILLISCNQEDKFPKVRKLSTYKSTEFLPTMENEISKNKNSVYCATLLFAWDEIRKEINEPIYITNNYKELIILNNSNTYKNVLKENEYEVSTTVDIDGIKAIAKFNKSLPFEVKLQSFKDQLVFNGEKVASFGIKVLENYEQLDVVEIVYYKNDNNFIIKLLPEDKEHEIIIFKTEKSFKTFGDMNKEIFELTKIGKLEKNNENIIWKYIFKEEDVLIIPKFKFNIETNYTNIEGSTFNTKNSEYFIEKAWQRTVFILDESGLEIESEAEIAIAIEEIEEVVEKPKPKKMIFDKAFYTILNRKDSDNPYFALWTFNTELMVKE